MSASLSREDHSDRLWAALTAVADLDEALKDDLFKAVYSTVTRSIVQDTELLADIIALARAYELTGA